MTTMINSLISKIANHVENYLKNFLKDKYVNKTIINSPFGEGNIVTDIPSLKVVNATFSSGQQINSLTNHNWENETLDLFEKGVTVTLDVSFWAKLESNTPCYKFECKIDVAHQDEKFEITRKFNEVSIKQFHTVNFEAQNNTYDSINNLLAGLLKENS